VVADQRGCPTYTVDLARCIVRLCRAEAAGIVHATNRGDCTWFDFASELIRGYERRPATDLCAPRSVLRTRCCPLPAFTRMALSCPPGRTQCSAT
jgi:dTDP-4-dehydrorhamnose reductase